MNPRNLSEYYQSIGQALPSVQQRQSIASQAGISGYRGTASQNAQLLSYLTSQQAPVQQVAPAGRPSPFPTTSQSNNQINLGDIDFDVQPIDLAPDPVRPTVNYNTVPSQPQLAPLNVTEQDFTTEAERLRTEIQAIESRMSNRANQRETAIQDAGLFDDIRTLANLRSELTRAENEEIAIPIEARQQLRGRGATITEFNQTTTPRLEDNVLEQLRYSTQVSSLNNAINTELDIINQRIDEEKEADKIFYEQKLQRLNQIENNYYDIMSSEQKMALELAKISNESSLMQSQFSNDIVKSQLKILEENGVPVDAFTDTPETVTQKYNDLLNGRRDLQVEQIGNSINTIDSLLARKGSIETNVGRFLGRGFLGAGSTEAIQARQSGEAKQWRQDLELFLASGVFKKLAEITEQSTLGAISQGEIDLVKAAASNIQQMASGRVNSSEKEFVKNLNLIKNFQMKDSLRTILNSNEYTAAGIKNINDTATLTDLYNKAQAQVQLEAQARLQRQQSGYSSGTGAITSLDDFANRIASNESAGSGGYRAIGPTVTKGQYAGQKALGKYQIMPGNIPQWSREVLGYSVTPQQFYDSPELQEQIARGKFQQYYNQYGNWDDVASVWFTGRPLAQANAAGARDVLGTTAQGYINKLYT